VDNPVDIAGAAFTVTYNTTALTLTDVQSTFFDTFANQFLGTPNAATAPTSVVVDSVTYNQPLITNNVSGTGTMIAAARCSAETGASNTTLFTLSFALNSGASATAYNVGITATTLDNTDAGYGLGADGIAGTADDAPETIPCLVGAVAGETDLTAAFPVIAVTSITSGSVTFSGGVDLDGDGLADDWENTHFGNLTTADATSDYDQDGYSDLQEYTNGSTYDPKVQDAPGGPGYDSSTDNRVEAFDATRTHRSYYTPNETFEVTIQISYSGVLTALGLEETIPDGWFYVLVGGDDAPTIPPTAGATGTIGFAWISVPASPVEFTYTVQVPEGEEGEKTFSGEVLYRRDAGELTETIPATTAEKKSFHSADYNTADWSINLSELLRVIQIYNVGSFHCDADGEDGYGLGAGDQNCTPHDLDYNSQDWSFGLSELLRMIQIYNVGFYHVDPAGEDGYGLGSAV